MFGQVNQSIAAKVLLAVSFLVVLLFGGTMWYDSISMEDALHQIQRDASVQLAEYSENTLQLAMETNNREQLQALMVKGAQLPGIEGLQVIAADGRIAFSSKEGEVGRMVTSTEDLRILDRAALSSEPVPEFRDNRTVVALPLRTNARCVACHAPMGKYLGTILFVRNVEGDKLKLDYIHMKSVWFFLGALFLTILLVYLLMRIIVLVPLFSILENAKLIAKGDLTHDVSVHSQDEVGQLAQSLQRMQEHLRRSFQASNDIAASIRDSISDLDNSSEELVAIAMEQSSGAAEQAASVHEVTSTAQEIAATSSQISANVESIRGVAEDTFRACVRGRDEVRNAVGGMDTVKDKVRAIADATVELGRKSQKIGNIVSIIDEISEQTHLLALNAAIEAAGAGEHGKRFSVVASEVRRLAERTVEATTEIKSLIEEIQESTNETVMITERGASIVLEGASKVELIGGSLEELLSLVMRSKESAKEMAVATQQQALAGNQLVMTISDINGVAVQVSRAAEQVEKSVLRLKHIANTLKELSEGNRELEKFTV